jgi:Helix-turn-helix domain
MIILKDDNFEIKINSGRWVEVNKFKKHHNRKIEWSKVKQSPILRHLTESLMSRLTYDLNGYGETILNYERIEEEQKITPKIKQPKDKIEGTTKKHSTKLYLKASEVEKIYGFNSRTLANWRSQGIGPKYYKVGGAVRYKVEDLDQFFETRKIRVL